MLRNKCLLTGASGFLGSHLLRALIGTGWDVVCTRRESTQFYRIRDVKDQVKWINLDFCDLSKIFVDEQFSVVIHCATEYGRGQSDPIKTIDANLILPLKILELAERNGVEVFVNTDTVLPKMVSSYALSKRQFYEWMTIYSQGISCINIAIEHFYGPGDDESKFVSFIVRKLLEKPASIDLTSGIQKRDFIFIDDVISAFMRILNTDRKAGLINYEIATGHSITIQDFVKLAAKLTLNETTRLNFGAIPLRKGEIMELNVDLSKIIALGWKPMITIENGLKRTIDATQNQYLYPNI